MIISTKMWIYTNADIHKMQVYTKSGIPTEMQLLYPENVDIMKSRYPKKCGYTQMQISKKCRYPQNMGIKNNYFQKNVDLHKLRYP